MKFGFGSRIFILKLTAQPKLVDIAQYFLHNSAWKGGIPNGQLV
jgi:hypothetical protein